MVEGWVSRETSRAGESSRSGESNGVGQQVCRRAGGPAENPEDHQRSEGGAEQQVSHVTPSVRNHMTHSLSGVCRLLTG